jgi:hypothetical protein
MRIFLILLLFTLLPLQSPAPATVAVSNEDGAVSSSSFDLDCGTCHANCAAAVLTIAATFADPAGIERVEHLEETRVRPWHARPYRAQWLTPIRAALSTAA